MPDEKGNMKTIPLLYLRAATAVLFVFISGCATAGRRENHENICRVDFIAAGDIMLDRGIGRLMAKKGKFYPYEKTSVFVKMHDLAFCNLECPVSGRGKRKQKRFAFRCSPPYFEGLKESGFNMYSIANNHICDYGRQGLMDTIDALSGAGFFYSGAGGTRQEADSAKIKEINGIKIAFIAHVDMPVMLEETPGSGEEPQPSARCGLQEITSEVAKAKKMADYVVVSFHWGEEYTNYPGKRQRTWAHACVDSGADLIIGHHPHVMESVEKYKGKIILYSLGNFIFDQYMPGTKDTMVFCCRFTKTGIESPFLLPVKITHGQPEFASGEDAVLIRKKITTYSKNFKVDFKKDNAKIMIE